MPISLLRTAPNFPFPTGHRLDPGQQRTPAQSHRTRRCASRKHQSIGAAQLLSIRDGRDTR